MSLQLKHLVKSNSVIQGGSFRLDREPTKAEFASFKYAVELVRECRSAGKEVRLCTMINDLALSSEQRPKSTGILSFPVEYIELLHTTALTLEEILIFYESTLRNRAMEDIRRGKNPSKLDINSHTCFAIPKCLNIMGRYYFDLEKMGFAQQVGFFARDPRAESEPDQSCPLGPVKGALFSGYVLQIEVLTYFVYSNGRISVGGYFNPNSTV